MRPSGKRIGLTPTQKERKKKRPSQAYMPEGRAQSCRSLSHTLFSFDRMQFDQEVLCEVLRCTR